VTTWPIGIGGHNKTPQSNLAGETERGTPRRAGKIR
jgi:hypothetical protein